MSICTYDPFGEGQAVYRFRYREEVNRHLILEDETYKIILNTKCGDDKIPIELKNLFGYINGLEIKNEDPLIERIHRKVEELNEGEWGHTMTT